VQNEKQMLTTVGIAHHRVTVDGDIH